MGRKFNNIKFDHIFSTPGQDNDGTYEYRTYEEGSTKLRVPPGVVFFLLGTVILVIVCMIRFPKVLEEYRVYKTADSRIAKGETSQVMEELISLADNHPNSRMIMVKGIRLAMQHGYYDMAGYLYSEYLAGKQASDAIIHEMNKYIGTLEKYYYSNNAIDEIFSSIEMVEVSDVYQDMLVRRLIELLEDPQSYRPIVNYYLGLFEYNKDTSRDYLLQCYNEDPNMFDVRSQLSVSYRRTGDYVTARKYIDEAIAKNKMDSSALRSLAIIELLEGKLEEALISARSSYEVNPEGLFVRETYLIALNMNGQITEAQTIKDELLASRGVIDEETISLINGEITLEEYYLEK